VIFLESLARPFLICHAIAAAVLIGATTHHLLWCRHYLWGSYGHAKAERRFATICAIMFVSTFIVGNMLYPTYKVRVRAEYFDNATAISDEVKLRVAQHKLVGMTPPPTPTVVTSLGPIARLFDIKEHWVALGCAASVALWVLSRKLHPKDEPRVLPLYVGLSAVQCGTAWLGGIVGLVTASYRSIGGPV
jgi:uncharacterized membrane protein YciS (DUF1049 family)